MNRSEVISALCFFRDVEKTVKLNERVIRNLENQFYNPLASMQISGMPRGSGQGSSVTERMALNVPPTVSKTIIELQTGIEKLGEIKAEILQEINTLPYEQKAIIFAFYIESQQWERISEQNNYSIRQCKRIRDNAVDGLGKRFRTNKIISKYKFPAS